MSKSAVPLAVRSVRPRPAVFGFTLIELLVAIGIIGIVVAIAAPKINLDGYRVNAAVRGVTAALSYAQRLAISLQHDVRVSFDAANNRIRVHEDSDNDGVMDPNERVTYTNLEEGVVFGIGGVAPVTYTNGNSGSATFNFSQQQAALPVVVFRRDGSASETGGFYINSVKGLALGTNDWVRAAEVIRSTGRVVWYTYTTGAWTRGS